MIRRVARTTAAAALVLVMLLAVVGCNSLAVRTVYLGTQPWIVYEDGGDGMRHQPGFGDADGMLFDMGREIDPSAVPFVMDGVGFPIDIAWFDGDGAFVSSLSMVPCDAAPCPLYYADGPYRWAVEAPVGGFADLRPTDRLVVGD